MQIQQLQKALADIPEQYKYIVSDIGEPTTMRSITATTTLSPQFTNDALHTHSIGDMVATFHIFMEVKQIQLTPYLFLAVRS